MKKILTRTAVILAVLCCSILSAAEVSREWTVFGPYSSLMHRLPDALINGIPETLRIGYMPRKAVKVTPADGKLDVAAVLKRKLPRRAAYICIPITSKKDGEKLNVGVGADWWFDLYLNGKPVGDTLAYGNGSWPPSASDYVYTLDLRKGKNYLVIGFIGGNGTQQLCFKANAVKKAVNGKSPYPAMLLGAEKLPPITEAGKKWRNGSGKYAFGPKDYTVAKEGFLKFAPRGKGVKRFAVKLHLEPGKQYCLNWSAWTARGKKPAVMIREKADGGIVYYARELANGRNKTGYFYAENPEPYAIIEVPCGSQSEITMLSLRRRIDRSAAFQDWRYQRFPAAAEMEGLSRSVKTPHFDIAPKLQGGKLKMFSIGTYWGQRDLIEMEQRFNMVFDRIFTNGHAIKPIPYWSRNKADEVFLKDQSAGIVRASKADCIFIDNCGASALTPVMIKRIMAEVKRGAGLVICTFDQPYYPYKDGRGKKAAEKMFKTFAPLFAKKATADTGFVNITAAGKKRIEFGTYGKGRAVMLFSAENVKGIGRMNFEIRSALIGKAILWASKRVPAELLKANLANGKISVSANRDLKVEAIIADSRCKELKKHNFELKKGASSSFAVPADFGAFPVVITSSAKGFSKDWDIVLVENKSSNIIKKVTVSAHAPLLKGYVELARRVRKGEKLEYCIYDGSGDLWHRSSVTAKTKNWCTIPCRGIPYAGGDLVVNLKNSAGKVIDTRSVPVSLAEAPDPEKPEFNLGIWSSPFSNYPAALYYKTLRDRYSLDHILTGNQSKQALAAFRYGILSCPAGASGQIYFGIDNRLKGKADAPERVVCLSSPALKKKLASVSRIIHSPLKGMRIKYLFGDHETNLLGYVRKAKAGSDFCFSPSCLASLREFMKKEYGTIQKLNDSWGTKFTAWEQVTPIVLKNALKTGNAARWIDHRRNMDKVWTDLAAFRIKELRKYYPEARGYIQNIHSSYTSNDSFSGVDYEQLLDLPMAGGASPEPYLNAFVRKENRFGNSQSGSMWHPSGGAVDDRDLSALRASRVVWQSVIMGQQNCLYYLQNWNSHSSLLFNDLFMVYPDLTLSKEGKALAEAMQRVRSGADRLIFTAEPDNSGIVMLYSRSSEHACTFWQASNKSNPLAKRLNPRYQQFEFFAPAIEDSQRNYSAVGTLLINQGALKKAKVLVLPFAQSISEKDAAKIREFVRGGGTVIADFRPAVVNGHGKFGKKGLLDDVFGIKQKLDWNFKVGKGTVRIGKNVFKDALIGDKVQAVTAKAAGKAGAVPVMLENNFGKGKAILLNFSTGDPAFRKYFGSCLDKLGVRKLYSCRMLERFWYTGQGRVTDKQIRADKEQDTVIDRGDTEDAGERETLSYENTSRPKQFRFTNGSAEIIGYFACRRGFAAGNGSMKMEFKVRKPGYVYDMVHGKYIGKTDKWVYTMPLEAVAVFAVIPFKVQAPAISAVAVKNLPSAARELSFKLTLPKAAAAVNYPVRITLTAPDGREVLHFAKTVSVRNGSADVKMLLPVNAAKGKWQLSAAEVFAGLKKSVSFNI